MRQGERERKKNREKAPFGEKLKDSENNYFYFQSIPLGVGQERPIVKRGVRGFKIISVFSVM